MTGLESLEEVFERNPLLFFAKVIIFDLMHCYIFSLIILFLGILCANADIKIQIDYRFDEAASTPFFDSPEKKEAMEAVADFYGILINDTLLRIDPSDFASSSASWTPFAVNPSTGAYGPVSGLQVVEENVIIVFVGGRALASLAEGSTASAAVGGFSPWPERVFGRGNPGAAVNPVSLRTDFAPWGGSIAFNDNVTFNYSLSENLSGHDFVSVALHEMGHVLGIGTADSWVNLLSTDESTFTGPLATASYGASPPVSPGVAGFPPEHFLSSAITSSAFGSFGTAHGTVIRSNFGPAPSANTASLNVLTDLDLAALCDIGWEIDPELKSPSWSSYTN